MLSLTTLATTQCQSSMFSKALMSSVMGSRYPRSHDAHTNYSDTTHMQSLTLPCFPPLYRHYTTKFSRPCLIKTCPVDIYDVQIKCCLLENREDEEERYGLSSFSRSSRKSFTCYHLQDRVTWSTIVCGCSYCWTGDKKKKKKKKCSNLQATWDNGHRVYSQD